MSLQAYALILPFLLLIATALYPWCIFRLQDEQLVVLVIFISCVIVQLSCTASVAP